MESFQTTLSFAGGRDAMTIIALYGGAPQGASGSRSGVGGLSICLKEQPGRRGRCCGRLRSRRWAAVGAPMLKRSADRASHRRHSRRRGLSLGATLRAGQAPARRPQACGIGRGWYSSVKGGKRSNGHRYPAYCSRHPVTLTKLSVPGALSPSSPPRAARRDALAPGCLKTAA